MTQFDVISVLVSIVFGLGLTHLCGGAFQLAYRRQLGATSLLLAGFTFVWALSFYGMSFALFPGDLDSDIESEARYRGFAIAFLVTLALDDVQTALLGTLFEPWYYLPFIGQYAVCAVVIHRASSAPVRRTVGGWMILSVVLWSLVVRRHLGQ